MKSATVEAAFSRDAFHRGRFWLIQPLHSGHRAGMDAMMLAAAVPSSFSGRLADFGAGAGAAGLAVAARCSAAEVVLVENAPQMLECAQKTLAEAGNAHLAKRACVLDADISATGNARKAAGLADNSFDYVVMNPPFNQPDDRATPDSLKRSAHVAHDGLLESWLRSAAAVVRPRGGISIIVRPQALPELLSALRGRFGGAQILPIHPRADRPAIRIIVRAIRGSRAALNLCPPLILHDNGSDRFSERADAINNGLATLFGD
ncbi:MAG: methyltransferase [Rhizobiaceae bacterium]|nr:methyltransferase [Rhizobiaceae bacterium]